MARRIYKYDKKLGKMVRIKAVPVLKGSHWPMTSETCALGVHQVTEAQRRLAAQGVQTDYETVVNAKGDAVCARPIFRDRAHKRDHYRAVGLADPDATSRLDAAPLHWQG